MQRSQARRSRYEVKAQIGGRELQANICSAQRMEMSAQSLIGDLAGSILAKAVAHDQEARQGLRRTVPCFRTAAIAIEKQQPIELVFALIRVHTKPTAR